MDITDPLLYAGPEWNPTVPYYVPSCLGDGRDGQKLFTANTTLTADVRASLIVIYPGVTLITNGFELVSQDLILNLGTVSCDGGDAVGNAVGNGAVNGLFTTCGARGGSGQQRTLSGGASTGTGNSQASANGSFTAEAFGASGGAGGGAGAGAGGTNAGTFTLDLSQSSPFMGPNPTQTATYALNGTDGSFYCITVGCGGGGGNAAVGGAGGGGAAMNRMRARRIINRNIVSARGGKGGDATGANGSGGGGGGGGRNIACGLIFGNGLWLVNGGAGGAGNGTGTAGNPGANGTNHFFP